jgi:hypothetical protein
MEIISLKKPPLNLKALLLFLLIVTQTLCFLGSTIADPDLWGYLAFGRLFWGQGHFPYLDVFAYVPTLKPWVYHEWLTGVLFYPLYQTLGGTGLQVLKYAFALATVGLIYLTARRRGADLLPTGLILFCCISAMSVGYSPVRAQVFTYFFFAFFLYLLETARLSGNWRWLWLLVPIQVVWCNLHGGFLAGLGLILLYAVGEALCRRPFLHYLLWFCLAGLATLINPYGFKYWTYLFHAVTMPRPDISEWISILASYQHGLVSGQGLFYLLALVCVGVLLAWRARWREVTPSLVCLLTLYLAVRQYRHLVFFALTFGAYLPLLLTDYFRELQNWPRLMTLNHRLGSKIPTLIIILLISLLSYRFASRNPFTLQLPTEPKLGIQYEMYYPLGAIGYIEQRHLSGKLLVFFDWGEYCLWRLYPQCRVAIDGRYETVYADDLTKKYFSFLWVQGDWREFLEEYPPDMILIEPRSRLYTRLSNDSRWCQVYADLGCALFQRQGQLLSGGVQAHNYP